MTTTITRETYAATYAERSEDGTYGVDLIHGDVERDTETGRMLYREEAGWDWHSAERQGGWNTSDADDLLASLGWRRTGEWEQNPDLGGQFGWTAPVEQA